MRTTLLCLVCAVTFSAMAQVPSYVPTSGLVAWCPLNNTAMDVGPNGHSGTTSGTTAAVDRFRNSVGATAFAEPFCTDAQDWIGFVGPDLAVERI